MPQRNVYIAVPSSRDGVRVLTMRSIMEGMVSIAREGWGVTLGESLQCFAPISLARNLAVARFLASDCDDLLFVDDDVAWQDGAMVKLLKHPVDVVAGAYPRRFPETSFPIRWVEEGAELWADPETGLLEVEGIAAGFMRLTRKACEQLVEAHKDDWYEQFGAPEGKAWPLFDFVREGRTFFSEDYTFCRKWRSLGGKVWVDPEVTFMHMGEAAFVGNLGDWLRSRMA